MEKTITLNDLQHYLHEINQIEERGSRRNLHIQGPAQLTLQKILRYSSALNVLKTRTAGTIFQLAN